MILALAYVTQSTSQSAKKIKERLAGLKRRHSDAPQALEKSIRVKQNDTGLLGRLSELLPRREAIRARLGQAGMEPDLSRYAMISGGVFLVGFVLFLMLGLSVVPALFMGITLGLGLPHIFVGMRASSRIAKFTKQFPEAIDLMVRGLKSGLPVNETVANVAVEVAAPTGLEFKRIVDEMRLGKTLDHALWDTAQRLDTPDFKFFVTSLAVQQETGGNLAETLSNLSTILRARQQMKLKVKALSSEAKASAWIVGSLPFIMLGLIMMLNYDYGIILFTHPQAIMAAIGGLIWMLIGVAVMAKMISFEV